MESSVKKKEKKATALYKTVHLGNCHMTLFLDFKLAIKLAELTSPNEGEKEKEKSAAPLLSSI